MVLLLVELPSALVIPFTMVVAMTASGHTLPRSSPHFIRSRDQALMTDAKAQSRKSTAALGL